MPDAGTHVIGEVFSLKNAERLLAELDHYEGTAEPGNAFRRVPVKVRLDRGGTVDAWSYEMGDSKARRRPIESGDFIHHRRHQGPTAGAGLRPLPPLHLCRAEQAAKRSGSRWNAR